MKRLYIYINIYITLGNPNVMWERNWVTPFLPVKVTLNSVLSTPLSQVPVDLASNLKKINETQCLILKIYCFGELHYCNSFAKYKAGSHCVCEVASGGLLSACLPCMQHWQRSVLQSSLQITCSGCLIDLLFLAFILAVCCLAEVKDE